MNINTSTGSYQFFELPDECPFCHNSILPNVISGYKGKDDLELFMSCPKSSCRKSFIGYYKHGNGNWYYDNRTSIGKVIKKEFNKSINEISPSFVDIYNQAYFTEQNDLLEICGVGYRKALEFLIKDYALLKNEKDTEKILKMRLANCIKEYVADDRIKKVAKRAVWLGNDETHYVRKWETKSLQDLKKLIELTLHWIEMEKLTEEFESEMPD